tara:strand:+ start:210 stop:497 length:288 start_codon:yes stop_codon:yes gene_type:complete
VSDYGIQIKGTSPILDKRPTRPLSSQSPFLSVHAEGGRIGLKEGGNGKWIQKVNKSIEERGTEGKCTPITKKGCTGKAKVLAKTFKRIAAKNKKA